MSVLTTLDKGTRVTVPGIGDGHVIACRVDSLGDPIYSVCFDDSAATPDGLYVARGCELVVY